MLDHLSSSETASMADLEIRVMAAREDGWPVEFCLTTGGAAQRYRGRLQKPRGTALPRRGEKLFAWLLADEMLKRGWFTFKGECRTRRIRLRLDDDPMLHTIPWEMICDPEESALAASADTPFSRYLTGDWPSIPAPLDGRLRVLVAVASPTNLAEYNLHPLNEAAERAAIDEAAALFGERIEVTFFSGPVTVDRLFHELAHGYHVLHLAAHGQMRSGAAALFLADDENRTLMLGEAVLENRFEVLASKPRLVFLACCESAVRDRHDVRAGLAPALFRAGIPAVLAMQDVVPEKTIMPFTRAFYPHLFREGMIDTAVNLARSTLVAGRQQGVSIPVLYSRLPENRLFSQPKPATVRTGLEDRYLASLTRAVLASARPKVAASDKVLDPGAVRHQWSDRLHVPDQGTSPLPAHIGLGELLREHGTLLVLGTDLVELQKEAAILAHEAAARAEDDHGQATPLPLNLAAWPFRKCHLNEWIPRLLAERYAIPLPYGTGLLKKNKLLLLVTGLERVPPTERGNCVEELNQFLQGYDGCPVVVFRDRPEQATSDTKLLLLGGAVRLLYEEAAHGPAASTRGDLFVEVRIRAQAEEGVPAEFSFEDQQSGERHFLSTTLPVAPLMEFGERSVDGRDLFAWLFADRDIREHWYLQRRRCTRHHLRLWLDPEEPLLCDLPWERMQPSEMAHSLARGDKDPVSRYVATREQRQPVPKARPLKVLVAITGKAGQVANADTDRDEELLRSALAGTGDTGVELKWLSGQAVTLPVLNDHLQAEFDILHLVTTLTFNREQGRSYLLLNDESGGITPIPDNEWCEMLASLGSRKPSLVVLSSCLHRPWGAAASPAYLAGVTIESGCAAMLTAAESEFDAAYAFWRVFYREVSRGEPLDVSANRARAYLPAAANPGGPAILFSGLREPHPFPLPRQASSADRGRRDELEILDRVQDFWIGSVLDKLTGETGFLQVPKTYPEGWVRRETVPGEQPDVLDAHDDILDIFDQADWFLLVTGEPGSGKTFEILKLTRDLINRARLDASLPLPIIFHLSSWPGPSMPLTQWLVGELYWMYQVPPKLGREWVAEGRIIPLLDGMDELRPLHHEPFVTAVNQLRASNAFPGLVVCCRQQTCTSLRDEGAVLALQRCLLLQPLDHDQVDRYLQGVGNPLTGVRLCLQEDETLRTLTTTPLMLFMLTFAYWGKTRTDIEAFDSNKARRTDIFDHFVVRLFHKTLSKIRQPFSFDWTCHWLAWMGDKMKADNMTDFFIERLQPTWLETPRQVRSYAWRSRLLTSSLMGVVIGWSPLPGVVAGCLLAWVTNHRFQPEATHKSGTHRRWHSVVRYGFIGGLTFGGMNILFYSLFGSTIEEILIPTFHLLHQLNEDIDPSKVYAFGLFTLGGSLMLFGFYGMLFGMTFGIKGNDDLTKDIKPVERFNWSIRDALKAGSLGFALGIPAGSLLFLAGGTAFRLLLSLSTTQNRIYDVLVGAVFGSLFGLLCALLVGWQSRTLEKRRRPGEGIKRTMSNMVKSATLIGIVSATWLATITSFLAFVVINELDDLLTAIISLVLCFPIIWVLSLLSFAPFAAFYHGGFYLIQHHSLRSILRRHHYIPRDWSAFLAFAAERAFLIQVGGMYRFFHISLRDYFANLRGDKDHLDRLRALIGNGPSQTVPPALNVAKE